MKILDIIELLETFASPKLASSWDNVGLLIGDKTAGTDKVLLALDLSPAVVDHAVEKGAGLIITHHPFFINPLLKITDPLILKLIRNDIALYTMHTNLDLVKEGVSKALADRIELKNPEFISQETDTYHIAVYVPPGDAKRVADALHNTGAGIIGNYSHCLNSYNVAGQFRPLTGSNPTLGSTGELEELEEIKLEFFVDEPLLETVLSAMRAAHPYETPAYAIYRLQQQSLNYGLGLCGELPEAMSLRNLARLVKERLQAPFIKLWLADQDLETEIRKVAVCGGSGSSLIDTVTGKADVFISADFTYHKIMTSRIPLIDAGHFHTEYPVLRTLKNILQTLDLHIDIMDIEAADINKLISL